MLDNEPTTDTPAEVPAAEAAAEAAPKKATRRRATAPAKAPAPAAEASADDAPAADPADEPAEKPKKAAKKAPAKKAAPRKKAVAVEEPPAEEPPAEEPPAEPTEEPLEELADATLEATDEAPAEATDDTADETADEPETAPRRRTRAPAVVVTFQAPETPAAKPRRRAGTAGAVSPSELLAADTADAEAEEAQAAEETEDDEAETGTGGNRRRRRGRRGRGGAARTAEDSTDDETATEDGDAEESDEDEGDETEGTSSGTRRRRRRRRSGGGGGAGADETDEDGVPTVVHVREPRQRQPRNRDGGGAADEDGVRGISGSTRMAAKRVRRQEGRDSGRKRAPILTEAEFLARRESVDRQMVVRQKGDRTQIAVLEDGILVEHYVTKQSATSYAGNVYLGRVQNVLPSMEAAFVDIGKGRNAVLYAGEVNWEGVPNGQRKIEQVLKSGQEVLVQVSKDPIGHKGARLTSQISLPGRYLVYVPESSMTGISRKLPEKERARLKDILKNVVPEGAGVIIRTAAEGVSEEEIAKDVRRLQAQWEVIQTKSQQGGAPKALHTEPDLVIKVVRDIFNEDFNGLTVQGESEWETIRDYVEFVAPDLAPRLKKHVGSSDVFAEHRIDEQLLKALDRKVYLPSGGSLVIDRTEAMVVVDVNTGKYVGKGGNLEETVTRNNLEAAEEIARQLRLRDLGGIIVIDFIDMVLESNRDLVVRRLVECLGRDRTKHQVAEVTSLGLVQMTRKRVGQGLLESFSETCEACNGRGVKVHTDPIDPKPQREDRERAPKVGPKAPVPAGSNPPAEEGSGSGGSRNRRRRGRGGGAVAVDPSTEVAELLETPLDLALETPVEDAVEQATEVVPGEAAVPEAAPEVAEVAVEAPVEDVVEQAEEVVLEPEAVATVEDVPAPEPETLAVSADEPVVPAEPVKKRRRAAGRPAGAPQ